MVLAARCSSLVGSSVCCQAEPAGGVGPLPIFCRGTPEARELSPVSDSGIRLGLGEPQKMPIMSDY